jgi:flagellar protein FliJ
MARPFPLQAARELAKRRLDDAAAALRGHAGRLRNAELKLAELEAFRGEYETQRNTELANGIEAGRLRGFEAFIGRLDQAIDAQRVDCSRQRAIWEGAREAWVAAYSRVQAMDALAQRHVETEQAREAGAERKREDEFSVRVAAIKAQQTG